MTSGHSRRDIRTLPPAGWAGRAKIAFALCSVSDATGKGSSFCMFLCKQTSPRQPPRCHRVPHHPLGWPSAPLPVQGSRGRGDLPPRPSLSAGFTWMGRFICNTQGERAVSGGAVPSLHPFRGEWQDSAPAWHRGTERGAGEGPARTEPGLGATPNQGCLGRRAMLQPWGRVPGAAGARRAAGASLGRLPAFLDCKGLQRRRQHPASPGPSSSAGTTLLFPILTQFRPPLARCRRVYPRA